MLVLQDHFSKYVVAYVVKDQTAHTAAETLRNGYFGLFSAPAYLISDQGKAFTGHIITHLCDLYGVQKLRTSPYHAQTNGQVERMNQMIIRMVSKLEEDKKACWSKHLPELLLAYNATRSAVTGYSPYYCKLLKTGFATNYASILKLVFSSSCSHGLSGFLVLRRALLFWGIFVRGFARREAC